MEPIRVLIVDDDAIVRRALPLFLAEAPDITVIGTAVDGGEAISMAAEKNPDVIVMDVNMPRVSGVSATSRILADHPSIRVLAVTTLGAYDAIIPMLRAGASGYLLKDSAPADIITGIRQVYLGNGTLSPSLTKRLIDDVLSSPNTPRVTLPADARLTERELAIVQQLACGQSNSEIALGLHLSEGTVKAHLGNIAGKWGVRDRLQILIHAVKAGLVAL